MLTSHIFLRLLLITPCCLAQLPSATARNTNAQRGKVEVETKEVKARTLKLKIPEDWKEQKTTSNMRAAQFALPDDVQLVIFYFGGPTGGIKANIDRWIGQFEDKDLKLEMKTGKCKAGTYIVVDCQGTWKKPDGPPFARKTVSTPNSRVINVILVEELEDKKEDYYFFKMSGAEKAVAKHVKHLRMSIGAEASKEKKFELEDAKN